MSLGKDENLQAKDKSERISKQTNLEQRNLGLNEQLWIVKCATRMQSGLENQLSGIIEENKEGIDNYLRDCLISLKQFGRNKYNFTIAVNLKLDPLNAIFDVVIKFPQKPKVIESEPRIVPLDDLLPGMEEVSQ